MSQKQFSYKEFTSSQAVLAYELEQRRQRNKAFSLRSFARLLNLSPSFVSDLLNGKSRLSPASAEEVSLQLKLNAMDKQYLCDLALLETERNTLRTEVAKARIAKYLSMPTYETLSEDKFRLVNDWYHPAIVELAKTHDFICDIAWISERIGISPDQVIDALVRLEEVGVIRFTSSQTFELTTAEVAVPGGYPSSAIRNYHASLLKLAACALETQGMSERTISSHTLAFPRDRLDEIRGRIQEFRHSLAKEIGAMGDSDEVYALCLQFFRLTQRKSSTPNNNSANAP
jgi:uncharacterized protein (TIGR02147 family)